MSLTIRKLSKTYPGGVEALAGIDLDIREGMFGLLGPNGAGKTTLMRTIATLQKADSGSVDLDGVDVLSERDRVRRRLGYLPQEFGLYPEVTAEYFLGYIARLKGISGRGERRDTVHFLLEQTNLLDVRRRKLGSFSGGMKQRFGIAQALVGDPSLLIVDEPTAGLDPEERNRFHNILSDISEDRIVILSTHIVDDVSVLCRELAILDGGRILLSGRVEEWVGRLEGKVWSVTVPKADLPMMEERHEVIFTRMLGGDVLVHVTGETAPAGFEAVAPDLYDVYFNAIRNARRTAVAAAADDQIGQAATDPSVN
ncbi:MAG TPA: ABC transporter ATP-binding protein [Candidatus Krumholzibacterium sp.]|nr:ABC transporter ATP-binding protein [Candidatus Krumholzibacterium sp.]